MQRRVVMRDTGRAWYPVRFQNYQIPAPFRMRAIDDASLRAEDLGESIEGRKCVDRNDSVRLVP